MTNEKLKKITEQVRECCPIVNQSAIVAALIQAEAIEEAARIQSAAILKAGDKIQNGLETVANYLT